MTFFLPNGMPILIPQEGSKQIEIKLAQLVADIENNLIMDIRLPVKMKLIVRGFSYNQDGLETTSVFSKYLGAVAGADAILIGKFEDFNTKIKISALLKDVQSREIILDASVPIPKEAKRKD